ncbi:hypothetical protein M422DRAFT_55528 [Sphaerobolus stellatus SS14]|uniref:RNA-dependent RNA polymerase n=1 Tax=Sphaerobolus stellatus (strain SS14) TaxID=990650 RepID=A0A0C9TBH4_SPHS4|nr:hypothetical protein M422DRAFT_55528 [Sphaerobolus stellatus SS14]
MLNQKCGTGFLTLPTKQLGTHFLNFIHQRRVNIKVKSHILRLTPSVTAPRSTLIRILKKVPFQDPDIAQAKEELKKALVHPLPLASLQIGIFLPQPAETGLPDGRLLSEFPHKLLRICIDDYTDIIAQNVIITFVNLKKVYMGWELGCAFLIFHLATAPAFELEEIYRTTTGKREDNENIRQRVSYFTEGHQRIAPYAHQIRLELKDEEESLELFVEMCRQAELPDPVWLRSGRVDVQRLNVFSSKNLNKIERWLKTLPWPIAFHCEALLRNLRLNALQLLSLEPRIIQLTKTRDVTTARDILRHFHTVLRSKAKAESLEKAFERAVQEHEVLRINDTHRSTTAFFEAHHVSFTPTAMRLEGLYIYQNINYVLSAETSVPSCDNISIIKTISFVLTSVTKTVFNTVEIMKSTVLASFENVSVAGRRFEFLGYSQSQLRSHSIFAVSPFYHPREGLVTADSIRAEVGIFDDILHFPALYAARVSQAFSGTEDSITLTADQWDEMEDTKKNGRYFTDGVGTISPDLAELI